VNQEIDKAESPIRRQQSGDCPGVDLARLRTALVDAEHALAAALAHVTESRGLFSAELRRDLIAIRAMRAHVDHGLWLDASQPPVETQHFQTVPPTDDQTVVDPATVPDVALLTAREKQVALLLARGLTNRQIAAELIITPTTARVHVEHILAKLGFHSRARLAAWMARQQIDHQ
jgi:DNA-binding NarL/FixJ family response regulator